MSNDEPTPTTRPRVRVLVDDRPTASPRQSSWLRDDLPYVLPMLVFLAMLQVGSTWKSLYAEMYVARTLVVPVILIACWRRYTPIRWNGWWLGVLVGVVGILRTRRLVRRRMAEAGVVVPPIREALARERNARRARRAAERDGREG